jgi:hypothetical protein
VALLEYTGGSGDVADLNDGRPTLHAVLMEIGDGSTPQSIGV